MNTTLNKQNVSRFRSKGVTVDCMSQKIIVDTKSLCEEFGKPFEIICEDENIINQILDLYLEMSRIYTCKAPF